MAADVGEEAGGREPPGARQRHCAAGGQAWPPTRHQRVGVEQRHGGVGHVLWVERGHLSHDVGDAGQATLGAAHRLRRSRGPRGEEQVAQGGGGDVVLHHVMGAGTLVGAEVAGCGPGVDHEHPVRGAVDHADRIPEVEAVDEAQVGRAGDEELALRVGQVSGQLVATVRGVGADHGGPDQGGGLEPEQEVHRVVEQESDVEGTGTAVGQQPRAPRCGGADGFGMGPAGSLRQDPRAIDLSQAEDVPCHRLLQCHLSPPRRRLGGI